MKVVYSNHHEQLISALAQSIAIDSKPFWRHIIIVPSESLRQYYLYYLAQIFGNTLAFDVHIGHSYLQLSADLGLCSLPSMTAQLATLSDFEICLVQVLSSLNQELVHDPLLQASPLLETLKQANGEQIWQLAQSLAKSFIHYATRSNMAHKLDEQPWDWQSYLWQKVRHSLGSKRCYYEIFQDLIHSLENKAQVRASFHLIGFCEASPAFLRWVKSLSINHQVQWYVLSASRLYWEDLDSFWKSQKLLYKVGSEHNQSQYDALEALLLERNPLLANMCSVAKPLAYFLNEHQTQSFDAYVLSSAISTITAYEDCWWQQMRCNQLPITLLRALQTDLLLMRSSFQSEKVQLTSDASLIIHQTPNRDVEIRAVHSLILRLLKDDPKLELHDILILAPDMSLYRKSIDRLFYKTKHLLPFCVQDTSHWAANGWISSLERLLVFALGDWHPIDYLEIIKLEPINKRFDTTNAQNLLKERLRVYPVAWGLDKEHAILTGHELNLDPKNSDYERTWDSFWSHFIDDVCTSQISCFLEADDELTDSHTPLWGSRSLTTLSHLHQVFITLLKPWYRRQQVSLKTWIEAVTHVCEKLFAPNDSPDEQEQLEQICSDLESLDDGSFISAQAFTALFIDRLKSLKPLWPKFNESILCFASLELMRSIPAKHILLIGLGEDQFGGSDPTYRWRWQKEIGIEMAPTSMQIARYSFLEAILSARESLHLFFSASSQELARPCHILSELISYLDESFEIDQQRFSDKQKAYHLVDQKDPTYQRWPLKQVSCQLKTDVKTSSHQNEPYTFVPDKSNAHSIEPSLADRGSAEPKKKIDIAQAHLIFCDPLRYYYRHRLQCDRPFFKAKIEQKLSLQPSYYQSRHWLELVKKDLATDQLEKRIETQSASDSLSSVWKQKVAELQLLKKHLKLEPQHLTHLFASEGLQLLQEPHYYQTNQASCASFSLDDWIIKGNLGSLDLDHPQIWLREPVAKARHDLARQLPSLLFAYHLKFLRSTQLTLIPMHAKGRCRYIDLQQIDTTSWLNHLIQAAIFCEKNPLLFSSDLHRFLMHGQAREYSQQLKQKIKIEDTTSSLLMPIYLHGLSCLHSDQSFEDLLVKHFLDSRRYLLNLWAPIFDVFKLTPLDEDEL